MLNPRVFWRNGDVISEDHFFALERWIESALGATAAHLVIPGVFRHPIKQPGYNDGKNLVLRQLSSTLIQIEISCFQGITSDGTLLAIGETRTFEFSCRQPAGGQKESVALISMIPAASRRDPAAARELEPGVPLYHPSADLSLSDETNSGIVIARLVAADGKVSIDQNYIPSGHFLDSTPMGIEAQRQLFEQFQQWKSLFERYLGEIKSTPELTQYFTAACQISRLCNFFGIILQQSRIGTMEYFLTLRQMFTQIRTELWLLSLVRPSHALQEAINALQGSMLLTTTDVTDLRALFASAQANIDALVTLMPELPAGVTPRRTLAIERADLVKEGVRNKILIYLIQEERFIKGTSRFEISLRDFTKIEPMAKDVRIAVEVGKSYAELLSLENILKNKPGERLSFIINCPPEIVTAERSKQLTLYLPTPLGDGIQDLKSKIQVIVTE